MRTIRKHLIGLTIIGGFIALAGLIQAQVTSRPVQSISATQPARADSIVQITAESQGLELVPPDEIPKSGTFWVTYGTHNFIPFPTLPPDYDPASTPVFSLGFNGQFLVDTTGGGLPQPSRQQAMLGITASSLVEAQANGVLDFINQVQETQLGVNDEMSPQAAYAPTPIDYGTNVWLECQTVSNNVVNGMIHNSGPLIPYTILSMQSLTLPTWNAEATFYGSGYTNFTSLALPKLGRNMLFLRARSKFAPRIIGAGVSHNVVIRRDGTVWAWGANDNGELGNGQWTDTNTPVQVTGLSNIVAVAVPPDGSFTLALDSSGKVWSWGAGGSGQLESV